MNPETDTYTITASVPLRQITAIRLEALPDPSLPRGGPGRDYYGNLMIREVKVEGVTLDQTATAMDDNSGAGQQGPGKKFPQVWVVDVSKEENNQRLPRQMVMVVGRTPTSAADAHVGPSLRIDHILGHRRRPIQGIGRFRLSVTDGARPRKRIVEITGSPAASAFQHSARKKNKTADHPDDRPLSQPGHRTRRPFATRIKDLQAQVQALGIPTTLVMSGKPGLLCNPTRPFVFAAASPRRTGRCPGRQIPSFLGTLPPMNRRIASHWRSGS